MYFIVFHCIVLFFIVFLVLYYIVLYCIVLYCMKLWAVRNDYIAADRVELDVKFCVNDVSDAADDGDEVEDVP